LRLMVVKSYNLIVYLSDFRVITFMADIRVNLATSNFTGYPNPPLHRMQNLFLLFFLVLM
jgi:hypothetical protein